MQFVKNGRPIPGISRPSTTTTNWTADESHPDQRRRLQQPDDGLELLDGKLKARSDDGVPVGQDVFLVDNTDKQNTEEVNTRDAHSPDQWRWAPIGREGKR